MDVAPQIDLRLELAAMALSRAGSLALACALLAAALAEEDARPAGAKRGESKIGGASAVRDAAGAGRSASASGRLQRAPMRGFPPRRVFLHGEDHAIKLTDLEKISRHCAR